MCTSHSGFCQWEKASPFSPNAFRVCEHAQKIKHLATLTFFDFLLCTDLLSVPTRSGQILRPHFNPAVGLGGGGQETKSIANISQPSKIRLASRKEIKAIPVSTGDQQSSPAVVKIPPGGWHNCVLYGLPHLTLADVA